MTVIAFLLPIVFLDGFYTSNTHLSTGVFYTLIMV